MQITSKEQLIAQGKRSNPEDTGIIPPKFEMTGQLKIIWPAKLLPRLKEKEQFYKHFQPKNNLYSNTNLR